MYGYKIINGRAVIDEQEAGIIISIFNGYISGLSMKACAPAPAACEDACYDLDIEPDDIEVADTVTVVWEIA